MCNGKEALGYDGMLVTPDNEPPLRKVQAEASPRRVYRVVLKNRNHMK